MKTLYALTLTLLLSANVSLAEQATSESEELVPVFIQNCNSFGNGVDYSFQSCVNSNFMAVSRATGGFYSHCNNFGREVDYFFTSCINNNFRQAQRLLNNSIYVQSCMNFDRLKLDYSFITCVNSNFRAIQRAVERK